MTFDNKIWDLLIVGGGISGGFLAYQMAKEGASVLLVDKEKFPRNKVCGCCLNTTALDILFESGLKDVIDSFQAPELKNLLLFCGKKQASISLPGGIAISRQRLDNAIVSSAVAEGATFLAETLASPLKTEADYSIVNLKFQDTHTRVRAKIVVSAEGLSGNFLQKVLGESPEVALDSLVGAGATLKAPTLLDYPQGSIFMSVGKGGYLGLVRTEDNALNIAAAWHTPFLKSQGGMLGSAETMLEKAGLPPINGLDATNWKGTVMLTRKASRVSSKRLFAVGDCASYVEPFTGEGMTWALKSVQALKPILLEGIKTWEPQLADRWEKDYSRIIRPQQKKARLLSFLIKQPALLTTGIHLLRAFPGFARPLLPQAKKWSL